MFFSILFYLSFLSIYLDMDMDMDIDIDIDIDSVYIYYYKNIRYIYIYVLYQWWDLETLWNMIRIYIYTYNGWD